MRLIHLGDLHLGKSLGDFDLIEDQQYILDQILEIVDKEMIDGVLIAGDVYDRAIPSEGATNLLDYFLKSLAERKVKTFMISGNHDSDDRLNYGSSLFEANQIYISAQFKRNLYKQTVSDKYGEVNIYLLPFVKASQVRHFYPDEKIENYDAADQFVAGKGADPELGGSEGAGTQSVGLVEKIGYDCFDGFDYVALGHIHSPQSVGRALQRISAQILSERGKQRQVSAVDHTWRKGRCQNRAP